MDIKNQIHSSTLPLRDLAFQTLRQAILSGELKPGERLLEAQLAKDLGVSRTPIRDALRELEHEGLVVVIPRRGTQVAQITEKSMQDVLEVRLALDELAISLACERITDSQIEQLHKAYDAFVIAVHSGNIKQIAAKDVEFHKIIFAAANNPRLTQIENNLAEQIYRYRYEYTKKRDVHNALIQEHEKILESLSARNKKAAVEAISLHIHNQEQAILKQIKCEEEQQ